MKSRDYYWAEKYPSLYRGVRCIGVRYIGVPLVEFEALLVCLSIPFIIYAHSVPDRHNCFRHDFRAVVQMPYSDVEVEHLGFAPGVM